MKKELQDLSNYMDSNTLQDYAIELCNKLGKTCLSILPKETSLGYLGRWGFYWLMFLFR